MICSTSAASFRERSASIFFEADSPAPKVVENAIETVQLAATAKGIRIESMLDPLLGVETTGDPERLQQVVWNLLSNVRSNSAGKGGQSAGCPGAASSRTSN